MTALDIKILLLSACLGFGLMSIAHADYWETHHHED